MFAFFGSKNNYGVPAGAILSTTRFPPAFTPRERAKVEAFFGRKARKWWQRLLPERHDQQRASRP
jgi:hypothetical protein